MPLRVLSYNMQEGGRWRLLRIARVIHDQQPDVVALLEATDRWAVAGLARYLGMHYAFGRANNAFHIAWLSRLPIERQENHRLPGLAKTLLEIEIDWNGTALQLFATHLAAGSDRIHPAEEAPLIVAQLREVARGPHLLVGDFNALHPDDDVGTPPPDFEMMDTSIDNDPRQAIREILAAGYVDCFRALNPDRPGYSFPAATPWLRLDYIFASPEMATHLLDCQLVDSRQARRASDHLPYMAEFRLTNGDAPCAECHVRTDDPFRGIRDQSVTTIDGERQFTRALVAYFALAYAISWVLWLPRIAAVRGWWSVDVPAWWHYTGALGPVAAALLVTAVTEGRAGLWQLLGRFSLARVKRGWLAFALLQPIVLLLLGLVVVRIVDGEWLSYSELSRTDDLPAIGLLPMLLVHTLSFGIGEETGWRGFALPRLQRTRTAMQSTHLLAILWAGWHIPTFFENESFMDMSPFQMLGWLAGIWMGAIFLTWLYNSSQGSLLAVVLWHGLFNLFSASEASDVLPAIITMGVILTAIVAIQLAGPVELRGFSPQSGPRQQYGRDAVMRDA